jgi:hypothetical protein
MNSLHVYDYNIPGTHNTCNCQPSLQCDDFDERYEEFKKLIIDLVATKSSKTFYKFSDGEYLWWKNVQNGSVAPGRRDSNIIDRDLTPFREGILKCDYNGINLHPDDYINFKEVFNKEPDFLVDHATGLIYNKWWTETFNGQIGLIGGDAKMDLIAELCGHQEYLDYLKFDGFTDYIKLPQRYLCDQIDYAEELLAEQLTKSTSKVFLIGIGHAQQALLHRMKYYTDALFVVVGSGICAYAGVQDNRRPYAAGWINYQLKDYDYTKIDIWRENFTNKKIIG